ncbi:hypothetical protein V492_02680 [Pseudogymnoascus sp. VKM F-4246]|nr:hypothetical protein V492_02680 [Pseudogymnoascus sp. VKM F-4246]
MAGFQMNNYYRPSQLSIDTQSERFFDDDDASILDENILDGSALDSGLDMSPSMSRRDSYALFSPKTEDWQHVDMQASNSNNPFGEHNPNNPFLNMGQASNTYPQQQPHNGWSLPNTSGSCTPMQTFDGLPAEFQSNSGFRTAPAHTLFGNGATQPSLFSPASTVVESMPASPQKDWAAPESIEHRGMPKRMRPGSPGLRSHSPLMRRDGIRKKNARFDIPAERNLLNIDHLIQQSTDEGEIKELKQQKRLLRNRQAALDSRQRKKMHTERLEDEKKHYTALLTELEEELADVKIALDACTRKEAQYQQYIENLRMEKEEMLRAHTIETGELRKKVSVLSEHVTKLEGAALAQPQQQQSFPSDFADIDALTMDGAWDGISFLHDFPASPTVKAESQSQALTTVSKSGDSSTILSDADKPAAQGLLLMLLLFGAFVASKGSSPAIPRMSDDVRAASATILSDILHDAGVSASAVMPAAAMSSASAQVHAQTHADWTQPSHVSLADLDPSPLAAYAESLTAPSAQQQHEQLFSLSAAQYNAAASPSFSSAPAPSSSAGRRNLADSLAAMREGARAGKTEVYTRSLLWEQVPRDVVRRFARLVEECEGGGGGEECEALG